MPDSPRRPRQAILISVDTLRADRLGCYGYARPTSPNIDRLARESLVFLNAFAPASYTHASFPAMFAGRYPGFTRTGFAVPYRFRYPIADATLMTALRAEGVSAAGFVSSIVVSHWYMDGLGAAFDHFDDDLTSAERNRADMIIRRGDETVDRALAWLDGREHDDFLLWLHLIDVHGPYAPLPGGRDDFHGDRHTPIAPFHLPHAGSEYGLERYDRSTAQLPSYQALPGNGGGVTGNGQQVTGDGRTGGLETTGPADLIEQTVGCEEREADFYRARYDANLSFADEVLGRFFAELERRGVMEDALVVLHSDHGEMMGEEAIYFFHGLTLHPAELRVPLIVRYPDQRTGFSFGPVSLVDVTPTILAHFGVEADDLGLQGVVLADAAPDYERAVYAQIPKQAAIIRYPYQVWARRGALDTFSQPYARLCRQDSAAPPIELPDAAALAEISTLNLIGHTSGIPADSGLPRGVTAMIEELAAFLQDADRERARTRPLVPADVSDDALVKDRLAALGYVE